MASRLDDEPDDEARKRFGQHFLESAWVTKLVDGLERRSPTIAFVEIGPGRGAITRRWQRRSARLLAVEVDRDLAAALDGASSCPT